MLKKEAAKACGLKASRIRGIKILRKSVDARKKSNVHFVLNVCLDISGKPIDPAKMNLRKGVRAKAYNPPKPFMVPDCSSIAKMPNFRRPVVVGAGPAGLFAALYLARAGLSPLVVERGRPVEQRMEDVDAFFSGGQLNPNSNIQFGEGGAGTFSDGKLNTGTKSPHIRHVLEEFVKAGAPEDILIDAQPHIGTDILPEVVRNIREAIIAAGGQFAFSTQFMEMAHASNVGEANSDTAEATALLRNLETGETYEVETSAIVLAIGHSARDTFEALYGEGVAMERKPFAVGVRIEHLQEEINRAQYGKAASHPALGPANYKLAVHNKDGRGVYTFCMCPGGTVVAASSEEGGVCVNGMSTNARDGKNANSALLVGIDPADLEGEGVFAGMHLQREMERQAYEIGKKAAGQPYAAPIQTLGDFLSGQRGYASKTVQPSYPRETAWVDLHECLPPFVAQAMKEAIPALDAKLHGFANPDSVLTGVEARSSSPIKITRNGKTLRSISTPAIYPAGEGAGYAGGIMSAATDGIRVAQAVQAQYAAEYGAAILAQGNPLIFPTDTVVGIGVSTNCPEALQVLYKAKGRDDRKPIAWLVGSIEDLRKYGRDIPQYAIDLAEKHWPGALTLIVNASSEVPREFQSEDGTIGLRMPASNQALALIRSLGCPVATTSANFAGQPPVSAMEDISPEFAPTITRLPSMSKGNANSSASTVLDCRSSQPVVLRAGTIPSL